MSEVDILVQQAKQALNAKDKAKARELLLKAVDLDERHEQAWLWLSGVSGSIDEQILCLENVLSINPLNDKARQGLDRLKKSSRAAAPPPAAPAPPPINDPFAGLSFDSDPNNPFGGGWNEQGRPAAAGSGKRVEQPSHEQYDDWINNMPLGKGADTPFGAPAADPFGSAAAPASDDPWSSVNAGFGAVGADPFGSSRTPAAPPPPTNDDPWSSASTTAWETKSASSRKAVPDPFTGAPSVPAFTDVDFGSDTFSDVDPFASTTAPPSSPPRFESPAPAASFEQPGFASPSDFKFDFEDNFFSAGEFDDAAFSEAAADIGDPFAELDAKKKTKKAGKTPKKAAVHVSPHFATLPDEFKRGGGSNRRLIAAAAVMGILNVLALVGVMLAL